MVKPELSDYFSKMNKKRKTIAGGFKSPEVRKKAFETRKRNKTENEQGEDRQSRPPIQPVDTDS